VGITEVIGKEGRDQGEAGQDGDKLRRSLEERARQDEDDAAEVEEDPRPGLPALQGTIDFDAEEGREDRDIVNDIKQGSRRSGKKLKYATGNPTTKD
jgi:hypothetical protein